MERLTREMTFEEEYSFLQKEAKELFDKEDRESEPPESHSVVRRALRCIKKLVAEVEPYKAYKDLEEQGLFLRLPCKVGDTVYIITKVFNGKEVIGAIGRRKIDSIGGNALNPIYVISKEPYELRFCPSEFGVRVFKTKEKAEAKLKELEGSEEE